MNLDDFLFYSMTAVFLTAFGYALAMLTLPIPTCT